MMKTSFGEGLSKDAMALLVARHWDKSPKVMKFLGLSTDEQPIVDPLQTQTETETSSEKGRDLNGILERWNLRGSKPVGVAGDTATQVQKSGTMFN
jgi:hypothetical protein